MKKLVFIKIGGSLITDKNNPFTAKPEVINQFAQDFAEVVTRNPHTQFILGNGAGSFAHYSVLKHKLHEGMNSPEQLIGFGEVNDSVTNLNSLVVQALLKKNIPVCSVNPSSIFTATNEQLESATLESMLGMMNAGLIPVVYGNVIHDTVKGCSIFSTERIFEILIDMFIQKTVTIDSVIHLVTVDGVLDEHKMVIPTITQHNIEEIKKHIYQTEGFDVTGGMLHKIEKSLQYAQKGIKTYIVNGNNYHWKKILTEDLAVGTQIM